MPETGIGEEMRDDLEEISDELNISTTDEDWELEGESEVIHPIAMLW